MKIVNLMEDTEGKNNCIFEHGLSFYIETENHKILVDTGASEYTWENAEKLGIDINNIDTVILSHGHYDHTGGLLSFIQKNPNVKIYMQSTAGYDYYNTKENKIKYIGIDKKILSLEKLVLLNHGVYKIDDEISIFSGVKQNRGCFHSNLTLKRKIDNKYVQDTFDHEQYVVISNKEKKILLSGCAHNGILNIIDSYKNLYKNYPDIVLSGFHLTQKGLYTDADVSFISDIANELKKLYTVFYTGHCTGEAAYDIMKKLMGDNLHYVHCGDTITF